VIPNIDDKSFQKFAYPGRRERTDIHLPLTYIQEKVYVLRQAGVNIITIAHALNMTGQSVRAHISSIKTKGWSI
jgi:DNA-binding NarL/FixJ family response regulator